MPKMSFEKYDELKKQLEGERVYVGMMLCKVQRLHRDGTLVMRIEDKKVIDEA